MKKYPIARPYIMKDEEKAVLEVLRSGNLSLGEQYKTFERRFAQKIGTRFACAVSSGTAGLHLAMIAAGIKSGDEVITSPFSFIASANAIIYTGARPVFIDIDPQTYNMNPDNLERAITNKTKAILVVHIFGQSADMGKISAVARKYKLKLIEDACESIGATHKSKNVGTFGESAVFSFYPNKQMTTGEGGMLVTNNKSVYNLCSSLRNQGRAENMQWLDHKYLGYNYRMSELHAALGIAQLNKLDFLLAERRKIVGYYNKYLGQYRDLLRLPATQADNNHTWFVYAVLLKNRAVNRNRLINELAAFGINTKPYLPSIHLISFYKERFGYKTGAFPVSEKVSNTSIALPLYIGLKENDIKYISEILIRIIYRNVKR